MARSSGLSSMLRRIPGTSVICSAVPRWLGCCTQRLSKHGFIKFLCCGQYVGIIEISGAGIEHTTPQDGFHLFCHDCFNVVRPQLVGLFIIKNLGEVVLHRMRCDGITGGHINTHRGQQRVEPGVQHDPVAAVNIILPDGRDGSNLEYHAIVQREWRRPAPTHCGSHPV